MCACFLFVFVCLCLVFRFPICSSLFCFCWLHSLEQRMALFLRFNCLINLLYFRFLPSITQLTYTSQPRVHVREIFRRIEDRRERTVTKRVHTTNNRLPIDDFFGQPKSSLPQEFKGGGGGTTSQRLQQVISLRTTFHTSLSLSLLYGHYFLQSSHDGQSALHNRPWNTLTLHGPTPNPRCRQNLHGKWCNPEQTDRLLMW